MIANIVFDFGGVLLDLEIKRTMDQLSEVMGIDFHKDIPDELMEMMKSYEMGQITRESFLWNMQHFSVHKNLLPKELIDAWNAMLLGWSGDKFSFLLNLRKQYKVYLLSNTNELHLEWVYKDLKENHNIHSFESTFFDSCHYSHIVGDRKPNISIFKNLIRLEKINPQETLFIDDTPENVIAAREAGLTAVHHVTNEDITKCISQYL